MIRPDFRATVASLLLTVVGAAAAAPSTTTAPSITLSAHPTRPSGIYHGSEAVTFHIDAVNSDGRTLSYVLKQDGGTTLTSGNVTVEHGTAEVTFTPARAGALQLAISLPGTGGGPGAKALGGAVVDPDKIVPSQPAPDDFDAFWSAKLAELAKVPMNARVEEVPLSTPTQPASPDLAKVGYYKVTLDNIRSTHIYGQLARPKSPGKYPAILIVQWAGVYPLQRAWVTDRAKEGWLALNIIAHDVPFDLSADEFQTLGQTKLKDYFYQGMDDRETSYFLRMYLACYRAADYLTTRDDWDGTVLLVSGTSQGGQQALITGGLSPKVTAVMALVPAGCDTTGATLGRATGFPYWQGRANGAAADNIMQTSRYFDASNFARHIKVPLLIGMGGIDVTCPPAGVLAAANQTQGRREVVFMPMAGHQGPHDGWGARAKAWTDAIRSHDPLPPH